MVRSTHLFRSRTIAKNSSFEFPEDDDLIMRIYRCLRFFKYADRTGFDFSDDISNYVYYTYFKAKHLEPGNINLSISPLKTKLSQQGYFGAYRSGELLYDFIGYFPKFASMNSFKEEYLLYLIDSAVLSKVIEKMIEKDHSSICNYPEKKNCIGMPPIKLKNNIPF